MEFHFAFVRLSLRRLAGHHFIWPYRPGRRDHGDRRHEMPGRADRRGGDDCLTAVHAIVEAIKADQLIDGHAGDFGGVFGLAQLGGCERYRATGSGRYCRARRCGGRLWR